MRAWLGVASRDHVRRGVELGIAQIGHGRRAGLARMHPQDWIVYYSPRATLGDKEPLQAFTAIGQIVDDEIWQADEGDFRPWRRRVDYLAGAVETSVRPLTATLELTRRPNWGYQLRRSLVELSPEDLAAIRQAMVGR